MVWYIKHCFFKKGHEHIYDISMDHIVTKVISFYLFKARYLQPSLYPLLFFLVLYPLVFLGVTFRMTPKVLPLNSVSSFSHCRFPGKLNQLHFSAPEEIWKEARQNELTLPVDGRDCEKTTAALGSTHVNCCIPFCGLHLQRLTILFAVKNDQIMPSVEESNMLEKSMFITWL